MLCHLVYLTGVFGRWYLKHIDHRVKVLLDYDFGFISRVYWHWLLYIMVFFLIFPLGLKEFCLVYPNYFGFTHRVFQRFSSHFSWKGFWGVIYITSPDFSHRVFKELFDWLQDHKKIKLITKEKKIDQGGVLWRN